MQKRIEILIFLACWKRPEITEICFLGIERLKSKFNIKAFAVISEEEMIPLCEKYGIQWTMYKNHPLGEKKNYGLKKCLELQWDYLVEIGSDDLLKDDLLKLYQQHFEAGAELITLGHFAYLNSENMDCHSVKTNQRYGIGRAINRSVVEKMDGKLWLDKGNVGMDNASTFLLAQKGIKEVRIKSDVPLAIDIKSEVNIWPFNYYTGSPIDFETVVSGLSEKEIDLIKSLQCATV